MFFFFKENLSIMQQSEHPIYNSLSIPSLHIEYTIQYKLLYISEDELSIP